MDRPKAEQDSEIKNLGIIMRKNRLEVLYIDEFEDKHIEDNVVTSFQHHQLYCDNGPSKHDFSDLPQQWKYLSDVVMLKQFPYHRFTEIVIVEKYKNLAIGFNQYLTKRPVVLFRESWQHFKSIKLGDIVSCKLGKMYVHVKKPTLILTDIYAFIGQQTAKEPFLEYETSVQRRLLKVTNFSFKVQNVRQVNGCPVIFADFGAIVIPRKLYKILDDEDVSKLIIVGSVKYSLIFMTKLRCACWRLEQDFDMYRDEILYARSIRGDFQAIGEEEKKWRRAINIGSKHIRLIKPDAAAGKRGLPLIDFNCDFLKLNGFITLKPAMKRTVVRKN